MSGANAAAAGRITLGDIAVNRLGFGAMRIARRGVRDEPANRAASLALRHRLPGLGGDFIDTASACGNCIASTLKRRAPNNSTPSRRCRRKA